MPDLILLRHGRSKWNDLNIFTGWQDVDLSPEGEDESRAAGRLLASEADLDLRVVHTSLLTRAIRTADLALHAADRSWLKVRRSWRLNERHYGDLTGKDKRQTAEEFSIPLPRLLTGVRTRSAPSWRTRQYRMHFAATHVGARRSVV